MMSDYKITKKLDCLECENCGYILESQVKSDKDCYMCGDKKCLLPVKMTIMNFDDYNWKRSMNRMGGFLKRRGI